MAIEFLGSSNVDGVCMGDSATDKIAFYGNQPVPQRAVSATPPSVGNMAQVVTYSANGGTAGGSLAGVTGANFTITTTGVTAANDFPLAVCKPTANVGWGIAGAFTGADLVDVQAVNPTAGAISPTASQQWQVTTLRGGTVLTKTWSPDAVLGTTAAAAGAGSSLVEQVVTLGGANAAATAYVNGAGQVTYISVTAGGSNYFVPPVVTITSANAISGPTTTPTTGTMAGLPGYQGGVGATAQAVVAANGVLTGVIVTNPGSGYTTAPTVSFSGGSGICKGMVVAASKPTHQANLGVCHARVIADNQIAVTFVNLGTANITPTAAQAWKFCGVTNAPPISTISQVVVTANVMVAAAANTSNQTPFTVLGIAATDQIVGWSANYGSQANVQYAPSSIAANTLNVGYSGGVPGCTPANGVYTIQVNRPQAPAPVVVHSMVLTPTVCAASNTTEVTYTVPTGVTFLSANQSILVNKQSFTANIAIVGSRVASTTTFCVTYLNNSATAITPPVEEYLVATFPAYLPTLAANLSEGSCYMPYSSSRTRAVAFQNEVYQTLVSLGLIRG